MAPITWRNVDGPDLSSAARILGLAQNSFNTAVDAFSRPVVQQQQTNEQNWQAMKDWNTNQVLNKFAGITDPNAAQNLLASEGF